MTVEELLETIGWNRVFYNKELGQYSLVREFYNEVIEDTQLNTIDEDDIEVNHTTKQIIIKY